MRSYAAAAPARVVAPKPSAPLPEIVKRAPDPPRHTPWWWLVAGLFLLAGLGYRLASIPAQKAVPAVVRTAIVKRGLIQRTIRVTGVTVAQKSATLLTPQMW